MASRSRRKTNLAPKHPSMSAAKHTASIKASRARDKPARSDGHASEGEKQNKSRSARLRSKAPLKPPNDARFKDEAMYCLCNQPDDGSPMVCCSSCNEWYHFHCVSLALEEASELEVYVCPTCAEKTGRRSIMRWENADVHQADSEPGLDEASVEQQTRLATPPPALPSSDWEDPDSEDEYVADSEKAKGKESSKRRITKRSISVDSSDGHEQASSRRIVHDSKASPASGSVLKRKSTSASHTPATKRKRASDTPIAVEEDPARKYCLGKLQEMFFPIFRRYPHTDSPDGDGTRVELGPENVTPEDEQRLENEAKVFASELEQCVFDIYAEPDKHGKPSVGSKYKERFRMLMFNLSQADRDAIHKRICCATISAKELALASSTDLANEETKQSIKIAEQQALEHSILQKAAAPRAKITHKGLQDIEDLNGGATALEREKEREREEEEERRERERQARQRAAEQHQKQRANSMGSAPSDSPVVVQGPTWGASPPGPAHAMSVDSFLSAAGDSDRSPPAGHPLFVASASEYRTPLPELELDIADFIHLDEEPVPSRDSVPDRPPALAAEESVATAEPVAAAQPDAAPTCGSPVAEAPSQVPKPETPVKPSFDLNTLWSAPKTEIAPQDAQEPLAPETKERPAEVDTTAHQGASDQDFDMFLEKENETEVASISQLPEDTEAILKAIPPMWCGEIAMPLDSSTAQVARVAARQIGGRNLGEHSPLWKTLIPGTMHIEGRVQTKNSAQFLLQMRLNPQKELIACAFSPEPGDEVLAAISDCLFKRNRHGLVFPWGHQPDEHSPGKELYVIPLPASMPLPDYMELLDDLRLPKTRTFDTVVGIWILTKGKLAPPRAPPSHPHLQPHPQPHPPPHPHPPPAGAPGMGRPVLAPPHAPRPPHHPGPAPLLPPALQAYPQLTGSALAAEVAALTPEQIQAILHALSSNGVHGNGNGGGNGIPGMPLLPVGVASALASTAAGAPPQPPPSSAVSAAPLPPLPPPPPLHPHWNGVGIPGFPHPPLPPLLYPPASAALPPPFGSPPHLMSPSVRPPPLLPLPPPPPMAVGSALDQGHYGGGDANGEREIRHGGAGYDRGEWQNGRGRGRGRGWGRGDGSYRPVDSGWRGRGASGGERAGPGGSPKRPPARRW